MLYFSYNDFMDFSDNRKLNVEENVYEYKIHNKKREDILNKEVKKLQELLKNKNELIIFLKDFFGFDEIKDSNKIKYCENSHFRLRKNNILYKILKKEIFIFIKIIDKKDNNISYKIYEHSSEIIKIWNKDKNKQSKRYPIVIPILIYIGKYDWKNNYTTNNKCIKYVLYENSKIKFSYNIINIKDLDDKNLNKMKSKVAKEILKIKEIHKSV